MTNIKDKIQKIKLARMSPERRFVGEYFSDLEMKYVQNLKGKIFFLKNGDPVMLYLKDGNYLWCNPTEIWNPLEKIIRQKNPIYNTDFMVRLKTREILAHYAFAYFDLENVIASIASTVVLESWRKHKFINKKP